MATFIKLYRKILDNPSLATDNNAFVMFTKILLKVDRKTGSFSIGRKQLSALCNLKSATTYRTLKRLVESGLVTTSSNTKFTIITVVNWDVYQAKYNSGEQLGNNLVTTSGSKSSTLQEEEKEEDIDTKVSIRAKTPSVDINEMFEMWQKITGLPINGQQQKNRFACSNLLKKYGKDGLTSMIQGVEMAMNDKFAPRISDFVALQSKQNDLLAWGRKNGGKNESNRFE